MNNLSPLSLCLIVKNESKYLEKCVLSAKDIVSQIIIVDTGSTDDTPEIAKSLTSEYYEIPFSSDFSKARNYALQFVKTPWVLFLDADESFEEIDRDRLLEQVINAPDHVFGYQLTRYNFFGTGGWYTSKNLKVFRNTPEIKYEGTVSESVTQSIRRSGGQIIDADVLLNHYGHCRDVISRNAKSHFYLKLMEDEVANQPSNSRLLGYIAMILRTLGRFEEAIQVADRGLNLTPESPHSNYCKAQVLRSVGKDTEALAYYTKAVEFNPQDPTALNMVGLMNMSLGNYDEAEESFLKTYQLNPLLIHVYVNLGLLCQAKGDFTKALEHFEKVAERNRGFLHDDFHCRFECDPYREFYYETIFKYGGLGYHIAYCRERLKNTQSIYHHGYEYATN